MRIWALLDDRPGNTTQTLGVAQALGNSLQAEITEKHLRFSGLKRLPNMAPIPALWRIDRRRSDELDSPWPDIVIGAGRRLAPVLRWIKRQHPSCFAVQLMNPELPCKDFDLVVLPRHDRVNGSDGNVLSLLGAPHKLTEELLAEHAAHWKAWIGDLPRPHIVLLAGGDSKHGSYSAADWTHLASAASKLADQAGGSLLVSTSRRTRDGVRHLELSLSAEHLYLHKWEAGTPPIANPYLGFLGLADAVIVTGESVSMLCEACFTGKPVLVFTSDRNSAPKFDRLHAGLYAEGFARPFGDDAAIGWTPRERLNPAAQIAQAVLSRLNP